MEMPSRVGAPGGSGGNGGGGREREREREREAQILLYSSDGSL